MACDARNNRSYGAGQPWPRGGQARCHLDPCVSVKRSANTSGRYEIGATSRREYREARVPARDPRASPLWQACDTGKPTCCSGLVCSWRPRGRGRTCRYISVTVRRSCYCAVHSPRANWTIILSPASSVLLLGGSMTSRRLYWFSDRMKTVPRNSGGARPAERAAATGALSGATPLFTAASTVIYTFEISRTRAAQRIQYKQLGTRYCTGKYS